MKDSILQIRKPLLTHCSTMLGYIVYSLIGYMHKGQDHTLGKTANKRLPLDLETSLLNGYTGSQKYSSQEVVR
jgi:hypothetical protein